MENDGIIVTIEVRRAAESLRGSPHQAFPVGFRPSMITTESTLRTALVGLFIWTRVGQAGAGTAATPLPRSQPEAQGIVSAAILAFEEAADAQIDALHHFRLVRRGHIVLNFSLGPTKQPQLVGRAP